MGAVSADLYRDQLAHVGSLFCFGVVYGYESLGAFALKQSFVQAAIAGIIKASRQKNGNVFR